MPVVPNPKLPQEDQAGGLDQTQYGNFRDKVDLYRGWIDDAYVEPDRDESIGGRLRKRKIKHVKPIADARY